MKLDYLADGSPACPLLRLYDFTSAEVNNFHTALSGLASGASERIEVDGLPYVESIGDCRLSLVLTNWDQAVQQLDTFNFECGFTASTWDRVAGLVEPFAKNAVGFQWLVDKPGEPNMLLSATGEW
jgi:hypothetical protein